MHGESIVPGIQVARSVRAVLLGSMAVGGKLPAQCRIAYFGSPTLPEANEEPLIAAEAILHDICSAFKREPIGVIRRQETGHVGDVFTEGLVPVHSQIGERPICVELRRERFTRGLEVIEVFLRPPVGKPPSSIELAALVVKLWLIS